MKTDLEVLEETYFYSTPRRPHGSIHFIHTVTMHTKEAESANAPPHPLRRLTAMGVGGLQSRMRSAILFSGHLLMPEKNLRFPTRRQPLNMLTINDLKSKMIVLIEGAPYQILEVKHLHMGRGGSSLQTRIKNLLTGQVLARNFKPADAFAEADVEKRTLGYLYGHRGECIFADPDNPSERFSLPAGALSETA